MPGSQEITFARQAGTVRSRKNPVVDLLSASIFKACYKNDPNLNACTTANAGPAIPKLKNGIPEYGIPPLDPLFIKRIKIDEKLLSVGLDMKDVQLHGLSQSKAKDIRIQIGSLTNTWKLFAPRLTFLGKYEASGRVLLLPITGKGNFNITLVGVDYVYEFKSDLVKKEDGEEYLVPTKGHVQHSVQRIYFNLENLFNGNKLLGDTMNAFLTENWKEIDGLLGPSFVETIAAAVKAIIDGITSRVSYKNILPTKP